MLTRWVPIKMERRGGGKGTIPAAFQKINRISVFIF